MPIETRPVFKGPIGTLTFMLNKLWEIMAEFVNQLRVDVDALIAGGGGTVTSVNDGTGIDVDNTDPANPIVNLNSASQASLVLANNAEPAFSKGNLVQGTGVTLTGTLTNRLVGAGNVTIDATGGGGGTWGSITGTLSAQTDLQAALDAKAGEESGIGIQIGTYNVGGVVIPVGWEASGIAENAYTLDGNWYLWCYPSGSIEIDIWKDTFTNIPVVGDSIVGGSYPAIVGGTFATGSFTGPVTVSLRDLIIAHVRSNTNVKWFKLVLSGDKAP